MLDILKIIIAITMAINIGCGSRDAHIVKVNKIDHDIYLIAYKIKNKSKGGSSVYFNDVYQYSIDGDGRKIFGVQFNDYNTISLQQVSQGRYKISVTYENSCNEYMAIIDKNDKITLEFICHADTL